MKPLFDYIQHFKFNNMLAIIVLPSMLYLLKVEPTLRDLLIVLITLMFRYYWEKSQSETKKDETIASMAKSIPDAPVQPITDVKKD